MKIAISLSLLIIFLGCQENGKVRSQSPSPPQLPPPWQFYHQAPSNNRPRRIKPNLHTAHVQPILEGNIILEIQAWKPTLGILPKHGPEYIIYHIIQPGTYSITHSLSKLQNITIITTDPTSITRPYGGEFGMPDALLITITKSNPIPQKPLTLTINPHNYF